MKNYFSSTEAAKIVGVDPQTIVNARKKGFFPGMVIGPGNSYRSPKREVYAYKRLLEETKKKKRLEDKKLSDRKKWLRSSGSSFEIGEIFDGYFKSYFTGGKRNAKLVYHYLLKIGALPRVFKDGEKLLIWESDLALKHKALRVSEIKMAQNILNKKKGSKNEHHK